MTEYRQQALLTRIAFATVAVLVSASVAFTGHQAWAQDKVNINGADLKTLTKLPGVGKKTAERIIAYRDANGPFKAVADLVKVKGIGRKTLAKFADLATAGAAGAIKGPKPVPATASPRSSDDTIDLTGTPPRGGEPPGKARKATIKAREATGKGRKAPKSPSAKKGIAGTININTASAADFQRLPGIGPSKAKAIVSYRTDNGPFKTKGDLVRVRGIGKGTLAKISDHLTVE